MIRIPAITSMPRTRDGRPRRRFVPWVAGTAMVVALAACGGGASPAGSIAAGGPSIGTPSSIPAGASAVASGVAVGPSSPGGASTPSGPLPSILSSHADPALEATLPAEVSGTPMQRSSATLAALLASGGDRTAVDAFLRGLGKSETDGTFAAAFDPTLAVGGGIFAFKVAGVTSDVLLPAIVSVEKADLGTGATTRQANVGGKTVTVVSVGDGVNDTEWVFGEGEVVFVVHASDESHAATFLQALP
jgi:hypothetical protein